MQARKNVMRLCLREGAGLDDATLAENAGWQAWSWIGEQGASVVQPSLSMRRATPGIIKLATVPTFLFCRLLLIGPKIHWR